MKVSATLPEPRSPCATRRLRAATSERGLGVWRGGDRGSALAACRGRPRADRLPWARLVMHRRLGRRSALARRSGWRSDAQPASRMTVSKQLGTKAARALERDRQLSRAASLIGPCATSAPTYGPKKSSSHCSTSGFAGGGFSVSAAGSGASAPGGMISTCSPGRPRFRRRRASAARKALLLQVGELLPQGLVAGLHLGDLDADRVRLLADRPAGVHLAADLHRQEGADDQQDRDPGDPAARGRDAHPHRPLGWRRPARGHLEAGHLPGSLARHFSTVQGDRRAVVHIRVLRTERSCYGGREHLFCLTRG